MRRPAGCLAMLLAAACGSGDDDASAVDASGVVLGDPDYRQGFGKDATGGAGKATYVVTSSAESGAGSLYEAFAPGGSASDKTIVFAVTTATLPSIVYVGSNVTIDGMANGMNGVTLDVPATAKRGLVIEDPASNIVIRGINFRSNAAPNVAAPEFDLLTVDGTNGGSISNVFIDRSTFVQATDGALDLTGNLSSVTVQRCLFYGTAKTMLVKYDTRRNISVHHNVFTHNGERNPQVKGDMQLFDFVNNVVHQNDVAFYPDGTPTSPYGTRVHSCGAGCDSVGNVVANLVKNVYIGEGAQMELLVDPGGGSNAGVYIDGNVCSPASNCAASASAAANPVPAQYAVVAMAPSRLASDLLPFAGAPNRTPLDQQRMDEVAAALP